MITLSNDPLEVCRRETLPLPNKIVEDFFRKPGNIADFESEVRNQIKRMLFECRFDIGLADHGMSPIYRNRERLFCEVDEKSRTHERRANHHVNCRSPIWHSWIDGLPSCVSLFLWHACNYTLLQKIRKLFGIRPIYSDRIEFSPVRRILDQTFIDVATKKKQVLKINLPPSQFSLDFVQDIDEMLDRRDVVRFYSRRRSSFVNIIEEQHDRIVFVGKLSDRVSQAGDFFLEQKVRQHLSLRGGGFSST